MFLGGCVGLVFFGGFFAYVFASFLAGRSRNCPEKFSCCQVWCFFRGRSLFLWFFFRRRRFSRFFFFKRQRSSSHRTPLHAHLFCCSLFLFLCPAAFVCFARFGRASRFLAFFRGAILGPGRFLGFSLDLLRPFSWDARRQGFFVCFSCACFSFFPFCFAATLFLDARVGSLTEVG